MLRRTSWAAAPSRRNQPALVPQRDAVGHAPRLDVPSSQSGPRSPGGTRPTCLADDVLHDRLTGHRLGAKAALAGACPPTRRCAGSACRWPRAGRLRPRRCTSAVHGTAGPGPVSASASAAASSLPDGRVGRPRRRPKPRRRCLRRCRRRRCRRLRCRRRRRPHLRCRHLRSRRRSPRPPPLSVTLSPASATSSPPQSHALHARTPAHPPAGQPASADARLRPALGAARGRRPGRRLEHAPNASARPATKPQRPCSMPKPTAPTPRGRLPARLRGTAEARRPGPSGCAGAQQRRTRQPAVERALPSEASAGGSFARARLAASRCALRPTMRRRPDRVAPRRAWP